jgi:hypothetical protein
MNQRQREQYRQRRHGQVVREHLSECLKWKWQRQRVQGFSWGVRMSGNGDGVLKIGCDKPSVRKVQIGNGPVFEVDVALAWNRWCRMSEVPRTPDHDPAMQAIEFVDQLGGGRPSGFESIKFVQVLAHLADELKKSTEERPESPTSTI